jgi:3-(3-hydroxy-phenyl)propionate hydroxylase
VPYEVVHRAIYTVHQRVADRYRAGRAFLAGDAAHLNNPLGGMGLNGGIHDAVNLAEKLVAVVRGDEPDTLLDGYERERRPVALDYINRISIANKRNLETRDPAEQRSFREYMSRTAADPALAKQYLLRISMIASLQKGEVVS